MVRYRSPGSFMYENAWVDNVDDIVAELASNALSKSLPYIVELPDDADETPAMPNEATDSMDTN